jgi:hypothetical protein
MRLDLDIPEAAELIQEMYEALLLKEGISE